LKLDPEKLELIKPALTARERSPEKLEGPLPKFQASLKKCKQVYKAKKMSIASSGFLSRLTVNKLQPSDSPLHTEPTRCQTHLAQTTSTLTSPAGPSRCQTALATTV